MHKIAGRNISNLRYTDDTTLTAESKEELKSLLLKVKEESENAGLKLNIQKMKIMASGPITSWETVESDIFYFLGLQNHYGQWLQPRNSKMFAPWKESYDKPRQYIKKQKQRQHFANKDPSSKCYDFSNGHGWMWEVDHREGWKKLKAVQSYPTLCNPMDYTVHGILLARILEWVAFRFSRGSSQPRDWTQVSRIAGRFFTTATPYIFYRGG